MFQEYPKALYKGGDPAAEHIIVQDVDEEADKRDDGFKMLGEDAADDKPKASTKTRKGAAE